MTEDDGEWFTDPEHHWLESDLVKCVVSTAAPEYKQSSCNRESQSESETKMQSCIRKQFQCPAY